MDPRQKKIRRLFIGILCVFSMPCLAYTHWLSPHQTEEISRAKNIYWCSIHTEKAGYYPLSFVTQEKPILVKDQLIPAGSKKTLTFDIYNDYPSAPSFFIKLAEEQVKGRLQFYITNESNITIVLYCW